MRILITGANGFLGSHIVECALQKGFEVIALLRKGANTDNLDHLKGFQSAAIDYQSVESIGNTLGKLGQFDLVIHNAGLTKSFTMDKYMKVNVHLTEKLIKAIKKTECLTSEGKLAYISSLAAIGPKGNDGPASNYGRSKVMAESHVKNSGIPYLIFRPTGIYGARDVQFVPLIKAMKMGIYPFMTPSDHKMTLINARDVAENVLLCASRYSNEHVHLEDGKIYSHDDLKKNLEEALQKSSAKVKIPIPIVKFALRISDAIDKSLKRPPTLALEHYAEISQNWDYDFSEERKRIPLTIRYPLKKGFEDAIAYYQRHNLI